MDVVHVDDPGALADPIRRTAGRISRPPAGGPLSFAHGGHPVGEAGQRLLRHPRPGAAGSQADGGRGPPRAEAQHRQPGPVRLRGSRGDAPGRHPQPAQRPRVRRLQGPALGPARGRAVLPEPQRHRRGHRGRLARQRGLRADRHVAAGVAEQRRRGARPDAGLSAVDRRGEPVRRPGGALPVRRERRLAARPRRHRREDHAAHQGASSIINPNNPTGAVYDRGDARAARRAGPPAQPRASSPTRSTTRSCTTTPSTPAPRRSRRTCCA